MKTNPKDAPKAVLLVIGIVGALALAAWRIVPMLGGDESTRSAANAKGEPAQTAQLQPSASGVSPETLIADIERWSQTPPAPAGGDPFREVLAPNRSGGSEAYRPPRMPGSIGNVPFMPGASFGGGGEGATIDFPEIRVHGVLVDKDPGESFAVLSIGGRMRFSKKGDELAEGLRLNEIRESGVWITAGKERAFIEVNRVYRPDGVADS